MARRRLRWTRRCGATWEKERCWSFRYRGWVGDSSVRSCGSRFLPKTDENAQEPVTKSLVRLIRRVRDILLARTASRQSRVSATRAKTDQGRQIKGCTAARLGGRRSPRPRVVCVSIPRAYKVCATKSMIPCSRLLPYYVALPQQHREKLQAARLPRQPEHGRPRRVRWTAIYPE
jgi:hypothetical protein